MISSKTKEKNWEKYLRNKTNVNLINKVDSNIPNKSKNFNFNNKNIVKDELNKINHKQDISPLENNFDNIKELKTLESYFPKQKKDHIDTKYLALIIKNNKSYLVNYYGQIMGNGISTNELIPLIKNKNIIGYNLKYDLRKLYVGHPKNSIYDIANINELISCGNNYIEIGENALGIYSFDYDKNNLIEHARIAILLHKKYKKLFPVLNSKFRIKHKNIPKKLI